MGIKWTDKEIEKLGSLLTSTDLTAVQIWARHFHHRSMESVRTRISKLRIPRKRLSVNGITDSVAGWSRRAGVDQNTIRSRLRLGWLPEEAVRIKPSHATQRLNIVIDGIAGSAKYHSRRLGVSLSAVYTWAQKKKVFSERVPREIPK